MSAGDAARTIREAVSALMIVFDSEKPRHGSAILAALDSLLAQNAALTEALIEARARFKRIEDAGELKTGFETRPVLATLLGNQAGMALAGQRRIDAALSPSAAREQEGAA